MIRADKKQQERLKEFYNKDKDELLDYAGYMFASCLFIYFFLMIFMPPYQIWEYPKDIMMLISACVSGMMGIVYYVSKFYNYKQKNKIEKMSEVMKYLPVSYKQQCIFIFRKTVKVCGCLAGVSVLSQSIFAITCLHTFSVGNILFPVTGIFVLPLAFVSIRMAVQRIL